jgi:hypothetical protein
VAVFISYDTLTGSSARTPRSWTHLTGLGAPAQVVGKPERHPGSTRCLTEAEGCAVQSAPVIGPWPPNIFGVPSWKAPEPCDHYAAY